MIDTRRLLGVFFAFFLVAFTSANVILNATKTFAVTKDGDTADWWKTAVFYQIYPRSFVDSDGDGEGDLKGAYSQLEYLKDLGVDAVWFSPIFASPMVDSGYDISNFLEINKLFGTQKDFENFLNKAHEMGIKVILDFVPNHTSDEHEWFKKSVAKTAPYEEYYVWVEGEEDTPPNAWESLFSGRAWTWHKEREAWYLHQFAEKQPDLNYRNPKVVAEMKNVLRHWLDLGVDGFRCDAVPFLFEDKKFADDDELKSKTQNLPETFEMIYEWRAVLDEDTYENKVMMTEAYASIPNMMKYYGNSVKDGAHFTFNFLMISELTSKSNAHDWALTLSKWMAYLPQKYTPNWVLGNHDNHRVGTRYGPSLVDGMNMLILTLPGVGVTYNGEEIGMIDGEVSWEETQDPSAINAGEENYLSVTRDPERTPFQWSDDKNAGFSTGDKTWLPVSDDYEDTNVRKQQGESESHLSVYKSLVKLRKEAAFKEGELDIKAVSDDVLVIARLLPKSTSYVTVINLGTSKQNVSLEKFVFLADTGEVVIRSVAAKNKIGSTVDFRSVLLDPNEAYVLKYEPETCKDDPNDDTDGASSTVASVLTVTIASIVHIFR